MPYSELRSRLRDAAVGYLRAGWPILPVETPTADRLICHHCPRDEATVRDWWSEEPYGIACRLGSAFDVVDMPATLGEPVFEALSQHHPPPVIEVPLTGRWQFLVTPGSPRIPDLPCASDVRLLGRGRWILLPPTPVVGGAVTTIGQGRLDGRLPHSLTLQWAALRALITLRRQPTEA